MSVRPWNVPAYRLVIESKRRSLEASVPEGSDQKV